MIGGGSATNNLGIGNVSGTNQYYLTIDPSYPK